MMMMNAVNAFILRQTDHLDALVRPYLDTVGVPLSHTFSPFYALVDRVDSHIHLTPSVIVFLMCTLVSFPLGLLHRKLPTGAVRHVFSAIVGLGFCFLTFQWMALHPIVCALVAYISIHLLPIRWSVKFTFVFCFAYLSAW